MDTIANDKLTDVLNVCAVVNVIVVDEIEKTKQIPEIPVPVTIIPTIIEGLIAVIATVKEGVIAVVVVAVVFDA